MRRVVGLAVVVVVLVWGVVPSHADVRVRSLLARTLA